MYRAVFVSVLIITFRIVIGPSAHAQTADAEFRLQLRWAEIVAEDAKRRHGEGSPEYAAALDGIANVYERKLKHEVLRTQIGGADTAEHARALEALAAYHESRHRSSEAAPLRQQAAAIREVFRKKVAAANEELQRLEAVLPANSMGVLKALGNLTALHYDNQNWSDVVAYSRRAVNIITVGIQRGPQSLEDEESSDEDRQRLRS